MTGRPKVGKIKSSSAAKKRLKRTGKKRFANEKPAHNHLLGQKSKRQKRLAGKKILTSTVYNKQMKRMLPN